MYIVLLDDKDAVTNKSKFPLVKPIKELLNMDNTTIMDRNTHVEVGAKTIPMDTKKQIINTIKNNGVKKVIKKQNKMKKK